MVRAIGPSEPGEAAAAGLVWAPRDTALSILQQIFADWEPAHQAWPITWAPTVSAAMAGATGGVLATLLKRQFPIPRVNFFIRNMALPLAVLTPAQMSYLAHKFLVTNDVLLADTACPVCLETRAGSLQLATGLLLPAVIAYAGVLVNGMKVNSEAVTPDMVRVRWLPKSWRGVASTASKTVSRNSAVLAGLAALNLVGVGCLVSLQVATREEVMEELERRVERDSEFKRLGNYGVNNTSMERKI